MMVEQISKGLSFAVKCRYPGVFHPRVQAGVVVQWGNVALSTGVRVGERGDGKLA